MILKFGDNVPQYCKDQYLKGKTYFTLYNCFKLTVCPMLTHHVCSICTGAGISASDGFVEFGSVEAFEDLPVKIAGTNIL